MEITRSPLVVRLNFVAPGVMSSVTNVNEILNGHVGLVVNCVDRLLLNAHVPDLQVTAKR